MIRIALSLVAGHARRTVRLAACIPTVLVIRALRSGARESRMPPRIRVLVVEAQLACARAEISELRRQRDGALATIERELGAESGGER